MRLFNGPLVSPTYCLLLFGFSYVLFSYVLFVYIYIYIGSLKVCNVRYLLSYMHWNMELYTRNAVKYSFLLSCIDRMLNYGLKSQQMILHAKLKSEMILTIFTIF